MVSDWENSDVTTQTVPIETHEVHSERLLRHAHRELENGDRLQASEKAWGAVAHAIKVVAAVRGWRYDTHRDASRIIVRLISELGDRVYLLYRTANNLHRNYYIDAMSIEELRRDLAYVEELVEMLNGIVRRG